MSENRLLTIEPSAHNLIESMRSIGYSFETALSDIIDNSISADANKIEIFLNVSNNNHFIQIIDNGNGMGEFELINAMKLGSKNPKELRDRNDLGRFGLGLKSSSFSQCRVLTVISKKASCIHGLRWDLDHIEKSDKFEVIELSNSQLNNIPNISKLSNDENGTIVMWENFDKMSLSSSNLSNELDKLMGFSIDHIALVYHRFLETSLEIFVNGEKVEGKDPFLKSHPGTQLLQKQNVVVDDEEISLHPFVLPHYSKLSAIDKRMSGKISDQYMNQGLYLYRNNRLIVWGSYFGANKRTELSKNLRIQVDIPNTLDYLWDIDVKKSQAKIPSKISKNLLSAITDGENVSRRVNEFKGTKETTKEVKLWDVITDRSGEFSVEINYEHPLLKSFEMQLNSGQKPLFDLLIKSLMEEIPVYSIYSKIGGGHQVKKVEDEEGLKNFIENTQPLKNLHGFNYREYLNHLLNSGDTSINELIINYIKNELEDF